MLLEKKLSKLQSIYYDFTTLLFFFLDADSTQSPL